MPNRYHPRAVLVVLAGLSFLIPASLQIVSAQTPLNKPKPGDLPQGILVLDGSPVHDVGELRVHASNWGALGSGPGTGFPFSNAPSAEWPAGSRVEYLWLGGLWVGALVDGIPKVSTAAYQTEFRPSADVRDVVYYSAFGTPGGNRLPSSAADDDEDGLIDEDKLDGYDDDADGQIDEDYAAISDQMLSRVFSDYDPSAIIIYPDHSPLNLLVHEESYQFDDPDYDDFVGFKFRIFSASPYPLQDVYIGVFADGDVGHRDIPNAYEDDATAFQQDILVDHGDHGVQAYDFAYWYDVDGDGGEAPAYCGIVMFDYPVATYANFSGAAAFEDGGDPTNDFERYELMASHTVERNGTVPRDYRTLVVIGPIDVLPSAVWIEVNFALVVTPRDDFTNVQHAATAYHGQWFDLDNDPATGIDGKEHQEHWYLPTDNPLPVAFTSFEARALSSNSVSIAWQTVADERIVGYEVFRVAGANPQPVRLTAGLIDSDQHQYVDKAVTPGERYAYFVVAHGTSGNQFTSQIQAVTVPFATLTLRQNAPNPFNQTTSIGLSLAERGDVHLAVYDVSGRRVATVVNGVRDAGEHNFEWNGTDDAGNRVGAGVYFYRLQAGKQTLTKKLVLMR